MPASRAAGGRPLGWGKLSPSFGRGGTVEEVIKEGTWKCPNCSARNRGRDVKCRSCGQARENVEFEYDEGAPEVTDAAQLVDATSGADWVCGFCSTSNRATVGQCRQCGGARGEGKNRQETDVPLGEQVAQPVRGNAAAAAPVAAGAGCGWLGWTIGGLFVLFLVLTFRTTEQLVSLTRSEWERVIPIEMQRPVVEEDWKVPAGGRVISSRQDLFGTNQVQTGTRRVQESYTEKIRSGTRRVKVGVKNLGNGHFKELYENRPVYSDRTRTRTVTKPVYVRVPILRTKYRYEVLRWQASREVWTKGIDTKPEWGKVELASGEREGVRKSTYKLQFTGEKGGTYDLEPKEELFMKLKTGSRYTARISGTGRLDEVVAP
jgi:hypothetical protein